MIELCPDREDKVVNPVDMMGRVRGVRWISAVVVNVCHILEAMSGESSSM